MIFPKDWTIEKLSTLSEDGINNGIFFDQKKTGTGYRHINIDQMYIGPQISTKGLKLLNVDDATFKRKQAKYGDVFFTRSSLVWDGIAKCNVLLDHSQDFTFDDHLMRVRPKKDIIIPQYLNEYCRTFAARKFFLTRAKRSTMTTVGQDDIGDLLVGFPSIKEQEKIAQILSTWDDAIEKMGALIDKQKSFRSYFRVNLLNIRDGKTPTSWIVKKIGEVCSTKSGGTPSRNKAEYFTGTIPWVKSGEVNAVRIFDTEEKITQEAINNSSAKVIQKGTVVVAMYGATAGKVEILEIDAALNQAVLAVTPDNINLIPNYTLHLLTELLPKKLSLAQGGQANLSAEIIKSIEVSLPPIAEQEKIAESLSSLDEIISTLEKIKNCFSSQKQGLMQQLLTGKKRVKV